MGGAAAAGVNPRERASFKKLFFLNHAWFSKKRKNPVNTITPYVKRV
jgi:hypothetical protein